MSETLEQLIKLLEAERDETKNRHPTDFEIAWREQIILENQAVEAVVKALSAGDSIRLIDKIIQKIKAGQQNSISEVWSGTNKKEDKK